MFVHGPWLLPRSWDRWAQLFDEAGYTAVTPGWPVVCGQPQPSGAAHLQPAIILVADDFDADTAERYGYVNRSGSPPSGDLARQPRGEHWVAPRSVYTW